MFLLNLAAAGESQTALNGKGQSPEAKGTEDGVAKVPGGAIRS